MPVAATVGPAVVRVENRRGQSGGTGSGFVIAHDDLLLVNAHVVAGASALRISLMDGEETGVVVVGEDLDTDLRSATGPGGQTYPTCKEERLGSPGKMALRNGH
jgi:S1-C subfamily serine protease